jgi:hypothetical protein
MPKPAFGFKESRLPLTCEALTLLPIAASLTRRRCANRGRTHSGNEEAERGVYAPRLRQGNGLGNRAARDRVG